MRNDHVFYGHIGGRYPTAEELEHHMREAHRLRAVAFGELARAAREQLVRLFRRPVRKLQPC